MKMCCCCGFESDNYRMFIKVGPRAFPSVRHLWGLYVCRSTIKCMERSEALEKQLRARDAADRLREAGYGVPS